VSETNLNDLKVDMRSAFSAQKNKGKEIELKKGISSNNLQKCFNYFSKKKKLIPIISRFYF